MLSHRITSSPFISHTFFLTSWSKSSSTTRASLSASSAGKRGARNASHASTYHPANAFVAVPAGQTVSHLAPQRAGEQSWFQGESIGGIGVLSVQGGDADGACRENRRIDEVLGSGNALHSTDGVHERDEGVG